jgi:hypothetical protein
LEGALGPVPYGGDADALLVPARDASGALSVFLVARGATGMSFERERGTNLEPFDRILFDGVRVTAADRLGASGDGSCILEWMAGRAATAYGFIQLGVLADALRRTAQHTSERKQFGKPLAGFQAVAHRAADCYIDIEALRSTLCVQYAARELALDGMVRPIRGATSFAAFARGQGLRGVILPAANAPEAAVVDDPLVLLGYPATQGPVARCGINLKRSDAAGVDDALALLQRPSPAQAHPSTTPPSWRAGVRGTKTSRRSPTSTGWR